MDRALPELDGVAALAEAGAGGRGGGEWGAKNSLTMKAGRHTDFFHTGHMSSLSPSLRLSVSESVGLSPRRPELQSGNSRILEKSQPTS